MPKRPDITAKPLKSALAIAALSGLTLAALPFISLVISQNASNTRHRECVARVQAGAPEDIESYYAGLRACDKKLDEETNLNRRYFHKSLSRLTLGLL